MTPLRWLAVVLSFGAAIGVSLYIVVSSWPAEGASVVLPVATHLLAFAVVLMEAGACGLKLTLAASALRVRLPFGPAIRTVLGGDFGAAITPARSGSEPARFVILAQAGVTAADTLLLLFTELFMEMVSLALVALGLAAAFRGSGPVIGSLVGLVGGYAGAVLGATGVAWMLARRSANGPPPRWARAVGLTGGRWRVVQRALRQVRASIGGLRGASVPLMSAALLASVVHVLLRLAVLPIVVLALVPAAAFPSASSLAPLVLWPLVFLYGGGVAPAPGGGGVVEIAFRAALHDDIPAAAFGSALIWWRFYTFYVYILLGAVAAGGTVLRALRPAHAPRVAGSPATS